jgi:hypothetical protein
MRLCELEKVIRERNNPLLKRSGEKLSCYLEGVTLEMVGSIVELKKVPGTWTINIVEKDDLPFHQLKRNSYVGGHNE